MSFHPQGQQQGDDNDDFDSMSSDRSRKHPRLDKSSVIVPKSFVLDPIKLSYFRDWRIEELVSKNDNEQLEYYSNLFMDVVTQNNTIISTPFRDDLVICATLLKYLIKKQKPKRKSVDGFDVSTYINTDMTDLEATEILTDWAMTPGSEINSKDVETDRTSTRKAAIGRIIAHHTHSRIMKFKRTTLQPPPGEKEFAIQLSCILVNMGEKTEIYDRTGDLYLHQILLSKISAERSAYLTWRENPHEIMNSQFKGDETNKLELPYIHITARQITKSTKWKSSKSLDDFIMLVSILQNQLDAPVVLLINSHIAYSVNYDYPVFVALTTNYATFGPKFGYIYKNEFVFIDKTTSYPIPELIYSWIIKSLQVLPEGSQAAPFNALQEVVCHPDRALASNEFLKYLP